MGMYTEKAKTPIDGFGTWEVTTEGDCEGRSTRNLGTHTGWFDDIAFKLADRAYYGLQFKPIDPELISKIHETGTEIQVSLAIETGTWDLHGEERAQYFRKMLHGRKVTIESGQYYACVKLIRGGSPAAREKARLEALKTNALAKLSEEEIKALGVKS